MKLKLFIIATLIFSGFRLFAQDFSLENNEGKIIYYNIIDSTSVEVTNIAGGTKENGGGSYKGHIIIPQQIDYNGQSFNIQGIGDYAFYDCEALDGINLPDTINYIGDGAFINCWRLTSIEIPESITEIGSFAFLNCDKITTISLPYTIRRIGSKAFYGCKRLQSINLPQYLTEIESGTFFNCISLSSIIIPNAILTIGDSAFYNCNSLYTATIGNHVQSIGHSAFFDCNNLSILILPNSIKTIHDKAFMNCVGLISLNLGSNIDTIGESAFQSCMRLSQIKIPNSVTTIKKKAFSKCFATRIITLGENLKNIESNAFSEDSNINTIYWRAIHITDYFNDIYVPEIEKHPFYNSEINQVIFSDSVQVIPAYAFSNTPIKKIYIGKDVKTIKDYAFSNCSKLNYISSAALEPPILNNRSFHDVDSTINLYVPCSAMERYQENALWNKFTNITCTYNITVNSNNPLWGSVIGTNHYKSNSNATIQAIPQDKYRFAQWDDGNIENPRIIKVTQDSTFVAIFELDINNGIEEYSHNPIIYPNPTTGILHIDIENIKSIVVYDIIGQFITRFENQNMIDLSHLCAGQYILKIQTQDGITSQSIILQ